MSQPHYTVKLDVYSFGVLILHVLSGEWPFPTDPFQPDPEVEGSIVPVAEVDRRAKYLEKFGRDHPLSDLIRQCLSNVPRQRPEAVHLLQQLESVRRGERPSVHIAAQDGIEERPSLPSPVQDGATVRRPQSKVYVNAWNLDDIKLHTIYRYHEVVYS